MKEGFAPVFDGESRVLILGSFPSVMSRREGFYYGNPQNRFWRMLASFFGEPLPCGIPEKREFLHRNHIALWDMVSLCEIDGSQDASIREEHVVDLGQILGHAPIEAILCNGAKAYELLERNFPAALPIALKMPSTSPANPRYLESVWHGALNRAFFGGTKGERSAFFEKKVDKTQKTR